MSDIITTLHPLNDENTNLYPNIKKENVPSKSIDIDRLDDDVINKFSNIENDIILLRSETSELHPSGVDTSTNILAFTTNKGVYIGSDTGHWYYWNGTQYVDGGVYQAIVNDDTYLQASYFINSGNYSNISDLNNLSDTKSWFISGIEDCNISNKPLGLTGNYLLTTYKYTYNSTIDVLVQLLKSANYNNLFYRRLKIGAGGWSTWTKTTEAEDTSITWLNSDQYSTYVTDWDNVKTKKQYYVVSGAFENILNSPQSIDNGIFISYKNYYNSSVYCVTQMVITQNGIVYTRNYNSIRDEWSNWITSNRTRIEIGPDGDFTTIQEGFEYAYNIGNCDVYIADGVYDLSSYVETLYTQHSSGIPIGNNNHYIFSSNSRLRCDYQGDNQTIKNEWSIFHAFDSDFIIENMSVDAKNIRYIIHDECGGTGLMLRYKHQYIGCDLYLDNTNHSMRDTYYHCIGGGLGYNGEIVIDKCVFESAYVNPDNQSDVQYHGNWDNTLTNGHSNLFITNSYFVHTMALSSPNTESRKKNVLFTGNSLATDLIFNGTSTAYWDVKSWNNEIR